MLKEIYPNLVNPMFAPIFYSGPYELPSYLVVVVDLEEAKVKKLALHGDNLYIQCVNKMIVLENLDCNAKNAIYDEVLLLQLIDSSFNTLSLTEVCLEKNKRHKSASYF